MELEFEIVSEEESQLRPAGKGREDPNLNPVLEPPKCVPAWFYRISYFQHFYLCVVVFAVDQQPRSFGSLLLGRLLNSSYGSITSGTSLESSLEFCWFFF